ncbi:caspase family protein [Streptomyces sp. NPDC012746]|uniref:caspase, EACC1-associated type n=1 Tax=Streptomyces sp. NPDC012746 TaxID=3364845 RepID=UPI003684A3F6
MLLEYERLARQANPGWTPSEVAEAAEGFGLLGMGGLPPEELFTWWHTDRHRFRVPRPNQITELANLVAIWGIWAGVELDFEKLLSLQREAWEEWKAAADRTEAALIQQHGKAQATKTGPTHAETPADAAQARKAMGDDVLAKIEENLAQNPELVEDRARQAEELRARLSPDLSHVQIRRPPPPRRRIVRQTPPPAEPRLTSPAPARASRPAAPPQTFINVEGWFSGWLQSELAARDLSAGELAEVLDIPAATVSAWLQGRAQPPAVMSNRVRMLLSGNKAAAPVVPTGALPCWQNGAAVLIGVSTYEEMDSVPSIANNIKSLRNLAADGLGIPVGNIFTVNDPATSAEVHVAIERASEAADPASGALFIYFAGHGWTDRGRLMLGLVGSSRSRQWSALDFNNLRIQIADSQIGSRVVVLDSCYSGAALDVLGPEDLASSAGIAGTYVLTAANATTAALAPPGEHFTTFTGLLIKALTEGIPGGPPVINTDVLYRYVERAARERGLPLPGRQIGGDGDRVEIMRNKWRG